MSDQKNYENNATHNSVYQIRLKGHLGSQWADVFVGLDITLEDSGTTLLTGPIVDQAALHALLRRIRDSGMTLISVRQLPSSDTNQSDS